MLRARSRKARFPAGRSELPRSSDVMNGRLRRGLIRCTARATSSLPVPVSPRISTVASVGATTSTRPSMRFMAALRAHNLLEVVLQLRGPLPSGVLRGGRDTRKILTKVIQRKGESFRTAVATRTGTRVPSLRINSFSNGVQAPNRRPSSCANSSKREIFGRREARPAQAAGHRSSRAVADQFEECVVGFRNSVELPGNDAGDAWFPRALAGRASASRRSFSSRSWRSLKSRTTRAKPCNSRCHPSAPS